MEYHVIAINFKSNLAYSLNLTRSEKFGVIRFGVNLCEIITKLSLLQFYLSMQFISSIMPDFFLFFLINTKSNLAYSNVTIGVENSSPLYYIINVDLCELVMKSPLFNFIRSSTIPRLFLNKFSIQFSLFIKRAQKVFFNRDLIYAKLQRRYALFNSIIIKLANQFGFIKI